MNILDRYIVRELVKVFALIIIALVSLYIIVDFFERVKMFISAHATAGQIIRYFIYSIPAICAQMLPVTFFLSVLITFARMSGHNELMAVKAGGISLYRAAAPVIAFSIFVVAASFVLSEYVTPYATQKVRHIKLVEIQKRKKTGTFKQNQIWYKNKDGIMNIAFINPDGRTVKGIRLNYLDHDMHLTKRIDAAEARWSDDTWTFIDVLVTTFPAEGPPHIEKHPSLAVALAEKPSDFMEAQKSADEMGYFELKKYIATLESEGYDATPYRADMHGKLAFSMVSIILALLGVSYSLRSERSGGIARSLGVGIVIGFSYWLVFAFTISLGRAGTLPPSVAAWSANAILGAAACYSFARIRT